MRTTFTAILAMATTLMVPAAMQAKGGDADKRLDAAADVMTEMMKANDKGIPQELLDKAQCVIVIPGLKKAGFIVGAKYGRGFATCRRSGGAGWTAPAAMRVEGGSVGFQIGGSEQDVILLVMNENGMKHLTTSKFTIGGEATAAAGPVGRDASAQTDAMLRAEMLSYSRSRGLFAGISLDGATMRPDEETNTEMYGSPMSNKDILTGSAVKAPAEAAKFLGVLSRTSMRKDK